LAHAVKKLEIPRSQARQTLQDLILLAGEMSRADLPVPDAALPSGGRFSILARRCDSVRAASREFDLAAERSAACCWLLWTISC
jgi:hypothetical protein